MTAWPPEGSRARDGGLDRVEVPGGGSLWLCGKHVVGPDPEAALVRAAEAELVVCLCERHELVDRYPDYVSWLGSGHPAAVWAPVPDMGVPSVGLVDELVTAVTGRLTGGVVIHCGAGHGRAPLLALCVLAHHGLVAGDGLALIQGSRPLAGPQTREQQAFVEHYAAVSHPADPGHGT